MKKNKSNPLFVELLIVVVALSILGFITYQQFALAEARSRDIQRKNDLNEISKAIRLYFADYGHLPSAVDSKKDPNINKTFGKPFVDDKDYVYMKQMPKENYLVNKPFCYLQNEASGSFTLYAQLEDKSDLQCKKEELSCGGVKYCYTYIVDANK
ncbi:MAG: hypothetical protein WCG91_02275 [Candidatus Shapirobacteria bacterium]